MRVSDFHLLSKKSYGHATLDMLNWIQGAPGGNCNHMKIGDFSVPCAGPKSGYMWREGKDWLWQTLEGSDQKKIKTFQIFFLTFQINTFSSWELFFSRMKASKVLREQIFAGIRILQVCTKIHLFYIFVQQK